MELTAYARALLALAAVLVLGRLLGRLLRHLGQPPVIGEVLAGILLGPSLIGPEWAARILPVESAPLLRAIAMLGMVLYMFRVGLELDTGLIRQRLRATLLIAHAGIAAPLLLGVVLAFWLAPGYAGGRGGRDALGVRAVSRRFRCWRASSPTAACRGSHWARWRWPAPRSVMSLPGACWQR